jgi:hypothetical protein
VQSTIRVAGALWRAPGGSADFTWTVAPDATKTTLKLSSATIAHGHEQVEKISVTHAGYWFVPYGADAAIPWLVSSPP